MFSKVVLLWMVRKALYTLLGAGATFGALYLNMHSNTNFDLHTLTLASFLGGLATAVARDVKNALAPDLLQLVTGQDPRKDG